MPAEKNWLATRTQLCYGEEWPNNTVVTVVAANAFTTADANVSVDDFAGQIALVIEAVAGTMSEATRLHIVSNTASPNPVFTTEEPLTVAGNTLAATDRLAVSRIGINPNETAIGAYTTDEFIGVIDDVSLLDVAQDIYDLYAHGDANLPFRREGIVMKRRYETSLPVTMVNGKLLYYPCGHVKDDANVKGANYSDVLSRAVYPGERTIDLNAAGPNWPADPSPILDYIIIDDANNPEIRQVTAGWGTKALTIDRPIRRYHANGMTAKDVRSDTFGYFTHTIDARNPSLSTMCLEAIFLGYDNQVPALDAPFWYPGISFKGARLGGTTDALFKIDFDVVGLSSELDTYTRSTVVDTYWTSTPYHFRMATVTVNGVTYHQSETIEGTLTRNMDTMYYHNTISANDPYENIPGRGTMTGSVTIPFHNKALWTLIKAGTAFDITWTYTRAANDDLLITMHGCKPTEGKLSMPTTGYVPQNIQVTANYITIVVKDNIPYY